MVEASVSALADQTNGSFMTNIPLIVLNEHSEYNVNKGNTAYLTKAFDVTTPPSIPFSTAKNADVETGSQHLSEGTPIWLAKILNGNTTEKANILQDITGTLSSFTGLTVIGDKNISDITYSKRSENTDSSITNVDRRSTAQMHLEIDLETTEQVMENVSESYTPFRNEIHKERYQTHTVSDKIERSPTTNLPENISGLEITQTQSTYGESPLISTESEISKKSTSDYVKDIKDIANVQNSTERIANSFSQGITNRPSVGKLSDATKILENDNTQTHVYGLSKDTLLLELREDFTESYYDLETSLPEENNGFLYDYTENAKPTGLILTTPSFDLFTTENVLIDLTNTTEITFGSTQFQPDGMKKENDTYGNTVSIQNATQGTWLSQDRIWSTEGPVLIPKENVAGRESLFTC